MSLQAQERRSYWPRDIESLARLGCQITTLFALQGLIILTFYAIAGPPYDPDRLPLGLQLDPIHAGVHLAVGLAAGYVGFFRPSTSMRFMQGFGILYLALAVLGTFTTFHLGMRLGFNENALHWSVGALAIVIGFRLVPESALRRGRE